MIHISMLSFFSFLSESLQGKTNVNVRGGRTNSGSYQYSFPAPGGRIGEVFIDQPERSRTADVSFALDGEHSGEGSFEDASEVLNAVINAVQQHSGKRKVDKISYYTSSPKKARIFDKIITRMGKTPARRKANVLM